MFCYLYCTKFNGNCQKLSNFEKHQHTLSNKKNLTEKRITRIQNLNINSKGESPQKADKIKCF